MTHRLARRSRALAAASALAVAGLTATPAPAAADLPGGYDAAPAARGAEWLSGQLEGGLLSYESGFGPTTDFGLSIDTALALDEVGGHPAAVASVRDAVAARLDEYISGEAFGDVGSTYAGAAGKALVLATTTGGNPRSFGGTDLVARVEGVTTDAGAAAGRIVDSSQYGDYANVLGQSFAARGLAASASLEAPAATDFLLAQQCSEGFFRQGFSAPDAGDQSCDGAAGARPSVDATATAVINLAPQAADADVAAAIERAVDWLASRQGEDGGLGSDADIAGQNANSTGLAGWAFQVAGQDEAAARAAAWSRAHQVVNVAPCAPFRVADQGAVAYDDSALAGARADGITAASEGQFLRATAQALPALVQAPNDHFQDLIADPHMPEFHRAGSMSGFPAWVAGGTPGSAVCLSVGARTAQGTVSMQGYAMPSVRLPRGTADRAGRLTAEDGSTRTVTFRVLDRLRIPVVLKRDRVARGSKQVVKVRGLERRESYRVVFRGRTLAGGRFSGKGETVRFVVRGATGKAKVRVVGEFADIRKATKTFRVTR